jgi:hypothetical protein
VQSAGVRWAIAWRAAAGRRPASTPYLLFGGFCGIKKSQAKLDGDLCIRKSCFEAACSGMRLRLGEAAAVMQVRSLQSFGLLPRRLVRRTLDVAATQALIVGIVAARRCGSAHIHAA